MISETGKNLGIFSFEKALQYAEERNLDLIEVARDVTPPVCKIADFGKYLYQQKKKGRIQKQKQKVGKIKGVRISLRISEHDLQIKANLAKKFLKKGHKVKVEVFLKGRERAFLEFAKEKLKSFLKEIQEEEIAIKTEGKISKTPRGLEVIIGKK